MNRCARVTEFGKPLNVEDMPLPETGHGQVIVKLTVSGVCHTGECLRMIIYIGHILVLRCYFSLLLGLDLSVMVTQIQIQK